MRHIILFIIILFCTQQACASQQTDFASRHISVGDGLPSNRVYDMVQDTDGFVWIGAANGLSRYDGYMFVNFDMLGTEAYQAQANIGNLFLDRKHQLLWVRTATLAYFCYDLQKQCFVSYCDVADSKVKFRKCIVGSDGIWMFDPQTGIRNVTCRDGKLLCTDFTKSNTALPSNNIKKLFEDQAGNVWAITDNAVARIDKTKQLTIVSSGTPILGGSTWKGKNFFVTDGNRILVFSTKGKKIQELQIPHTRQLVNSSTHQLVSFIWNNKWVMYFGSTPIVMDCESHKFTLPEELQIDKAKWGGEIGGKPFVTSEGTVCLFLKNGKMKRLNLIPNMLFTANRNQMFDIAVGTDGNFYIATYGNGLFVYNPHDDSLSHYGSTGSKPLLASNYLTSIMADRTGGIWVSQLQAGISYINPINLSTKAYWLPKPLLAGDFANYISRIFHTSEGLLVSTRDNCLYSLDTQTGGFKLKEKFPSSPYAYAEDDGGHIWIGLRNNGLLIDGIHYGRSEKQGRHFPCNNIYDIVVDRYNRAWIATVDQGLLQATLSRDGSLRTKSFLNAGVSENRINDLTIDRNGVLWIATSNGLAAVNTNLRNIDKKDFRHFNTENRLFPFNDIRYIAIARSGQMWIGGLGSGIAQCDMADIDKPVVCVYDKRHGLPNNNISTITEDRWGNIWAGTEGKLVRIDSKNKYIDSYEIGNSVMSNLFSENCSMALSDGRLLFGTAEGIAVVKPAANEIDTGIELPVARISDLAVNGVSIHVLGGWQKYSRGDRLSMAYTENTLRINFSNFDYANTPSSMFQYYLEGYEKDWHDPVCTHSVEYGNLPPGKYIFHLRPVKGTEISGKETTLEFEIRQRWWNTWWAWIIYLLLISGFTYYIYISWRERFYMNQQMKMEKEQTEFRLNFFTHVAHEFRTPLAIITGAVGKLPKDTTQGVSKTTLQGIRRGTRRLTLLVNQLMEFRKVNSDNLRLMVENDDIVGYVHDIYHDFWEAAQLKQQQFIFLPFCKKYDTCFDKHIVDTVVYNLISNAIKYTPEKGAIYVKLKLDEKQRQLAVVVEDNGPGIGEDRLENLYKPFMGGYASTGGMGIGLYTAHRMAEIHKGSLHYEKLAIGSRFTFFLPSDGSFYSAEDYKSISAIDSSRKAERPAEQIVSELMPEAMNGQQVIIIEDDPDMRMQLMAEMGQYFKTTGYESGQTGFEAVCRLKPSLVICDVILPDMNGFDIVSKLKDNTATAGIPVIMLTALDDDTHQIKGYNAGADDYMVKPCNFQILIARTVQLIKWSLQNRQISQPDTTNTAQPDNQNTSQPQIIITSKADQVFLQRMQLLVNQHIADSEFTIDQMAQMMNMGRTKFYGKVKDLTGMSPNKYLVAERMRMAAELLSDGTRTVSEVCRSVGIQDLSYFNKCFKAKYGVSPGKYNK